jgi:hypothetical protein
LSRLKFLKTKSAAKKSKKKARELKAYWRGAGNFQKTKNDKERRQ